MTDSLTVVIAAIALYIAYQQWHTNRRKLDVDLYDRRLRIYQAVDKYISVVVARLDPTVDDFKEFHRATAEADFLFGPDIREYLEQLSQRSLALRRVQQESRQAPTAPLRPSGYDSAEVAQRQHEHAVWFAGQHKAALERFGKYMKLFLKQRREPQ